MFTKRRLKGLDETEPSMGLWGARGRAVDVFDLRPLNPQRRGIVSKTFVWKGLSADVRCVGGSTHTWE